jgi:mxaA protein
MKSVFIALGLLFWIAVSSASEIVIEARNPRPFGYVVGDKFDQEIIIRAPLGALLDTNKMPKPGRLNAWLELRNVDVTEITGASGKTYRVKLNFQLPNAPLEVRVIELPAQKFAFLDAKKSIEIKSVEWPITIGPITPPEVLARDGLEAMRPDVVPQGIDTQPIEQRLIYYGIALAAMLLAWCYRFFGVPYLASRRRPFTRAYRQLDRLAKQSTPQAFSQAIEQLHQALNETAGKSIFIDNIEQFLAHHPIPANLAAMTRQFFHLSREEFFGAGVADSQRSIPWMVEFCRAWRDVERGVV